MPNRGRPGIVDGNTVKTLSSVYPDIKTRRGIINKWYEMQAFSVVKDMEGVNFLTDQNKKYINCSVLTELGRLWNEEDIQLVARHICKRAEAEKLSIKQWVNICRYIRLTGELI